MPCIAVAVADGHGDARHDRSRTGAALAVDAALAEMMALHRMHVDGISRPVLRSDFRTDFPRRVTRRWRELVRYDDEWKSPDTLSPFDLQDQPYIRYGTTLLAALIVTDSILVGQIGDGDLLLVRPDGSIESPLPKDPFLTGKETYSLSSPDAHLLWRTATIDRGNGGVLIAATDGISDSFDGSEGEEFFVFIRSLVDRIRTYGEEAVAKAMNGWLDRYSATASGDDVTLVYICINPVSIPTDSSLPEQDNEGDIAGSG
jgi:hypothetical protein